MRGVVLTAYMARNPGVPYADLAVLAASLIQRQIGPIAITLFTDSEARDHLRKHEYRFSTLFQEIIADDDPQPVNLRRFPGTDHTPTQFNNGTRSSLYHRVAYDEMILMDTDFLLYEDSLKQVWGSHHPIRINNKISSILYPESPVVSRLGDLTIPLYWATVGYYRRCAETDRFFALVDYARANYEWFSRVYRFSAHLYRNDYTFSIAAHLLGGQTGNCPSISTLPNEVLRFGWDNDRVIDFDSRGLWIAGDDHIKGMVPIHVQDQNIHVLNKPSLIPYLERMIAQEWDLLTR